VIGSRLSAALKSIAAAGGLDVQRTANTLFEARKRAIRRFGIDLVLDVGANTGQYGDDLRRGGYARSIVSFEPLAVAHATLAARTQQDESWQSRNTALGSMDGESDILEARNSVSSSLLPVTSVSTEANSGTEQTRRSKITVNRLDTLFSELASRASNIMLKLDTQGYELEILRGAETSLERINVVECELSLREVYRGQPLFFEVSRHLYERGFFVVWIERGFQGPSRELLQVDALFVREKAGAVRARPGMGTSR
jgi:FkbM family methyltransferase